MKNVFYFRYINSIGGIEAFFYYLAKKYKDWDITIYYNSGDKNQLSRLRKYVRCKKYKGETIKCDKAFFCYNLDIIDNVEAKEYIQIAHGDYKGLGISPNIHPKITRYLGVSQLACDTYKEVTGYDTELAYNPIEIEKPQKVLNLISATRLTKEKGKGRMKKLAEMLDNAGIPFLWTIFTDDTQAIENPSIAYMKPRLDITNYIANADYLVQLSDSEAYCYSVVESLMLGTPVIVTDMPVMKEIGVDETNGFIVDFDMKDVPIDKIYKGIKPFKYEPKEDNWKDILEKGKSTYKGELEYFHKVRATDEYEKNNVVDKELKIIPKKGYEFIVDDDRYEILQGNNNYNAKFVEEVKQ